MTRGESDKKMKHVANTIPGMFTVFAVAVIFPLAQEIGFSEYEAAIIVTIVFAANLWHGLGYVVADWIRPAEELGEEIVNA